MTARLGSRATIAPFSAPTLVPSTRSGVMSRSNSACSMPTSTAPSTPPPPSTNAVLSTPLVTEVTLAADELRVLGARALHHAVLDPENQDRNQPGHQHQQHERHR